MPVAIKKCYKEIITVHVENTQKEPIYVKVKNDALIKWLKGTTVICVDNSN